MQENVNYEQLMDWLNFIDELVAAERADIKAACASVSIKLNEVGFQGLATSTIDSSFSTMNNYFEQSSNYIRELINWVNVNVIKEYQTTDQSIRERFQQSLDGSFQANYSSKNGYNFEEYLTSDGARFGEASDWLNKIDNYGK